MFSSQTTLSGHVTLYPWKVRDLLLNISLFSVYIRGLVLTSVDKMLNYCEQWQAVFTAFSFLNSKFSQKENFEMVAAGGNSCGWVANSGCEIWQDCVCQNKYELLWNVAWLLGIAKQAQRVNVYGIFAFAPNAAVILAPLLIKKILRDKITGEYGEYRIKINSTIIKLWDTALLFYCAKVL